MCARGTGVVGSHGCPIRQFQWQLLSSATPSQASNYNTTVNCRPPSNFETPFWEKVVKSVGSFCLTGRVSNALPDSPRNQSSDWCQSGQARSDPCTHCTDEEATADIGHTNSVGGFVDCWSKLLRSVSKFVETIYPLGVKAVKISSPV